jgi:hypothetical protein
MRLASALDQARRLLDGLAKPNVMHRNTQQFTARLVILDDTKPELHGIESSGSHGFIPDRLQIRQRLSRMLHLPYSACRGPKVSKYFSIGPIGSDSVSFLTDYWAMRAVFM